MGEVHKMRGTGTWYVTIAVIYEPADEPGREAQMIWQGNDILPGRPALARFLATFKLGRVLRTKDLRGRLVNWRTGPVKGAAMTIQ